MPLNVLKCLEMSKKIQNAQMYPKYIQKHFKILKNSENVPRMSRNIHKNQEITLKSLKNILIEM